MVAEEHSLQPVAVQLTHNPAPAYVPAGHLVTVDDEDNAVVGSG